MCFGVDGVTLRYGDRRQRRVNLTVFVTDCMVNYLSVTFAPETCRLGFWWHHALADNVVAFGLSTSSWEMRHEEPFFETAGACNT